MVEHLPQMFWANLTNQVRTRRGEKQSATGLARGRDQPLGEFFEKIGVSVSLDIAGIETVTEALEVVDSERTIGRHIFEESIATPRQSALPNLEMRNIQPVLEDLSRSGFEDFEIAF